MITDNQRFKPILLAALTASMFSLGLALFVQYGFDLRPCDLCELQRIPYLLAILLALLGLWRLKHLKCIILLIILVFAGGSLLAAYHVAVEKQWVSGPSSCTGSSAPASQSMEELLARIQHAPIVACDQPQWEFHGITMAALNALWSWCLALGVFAALRYRKEEPPHA